MTELSLRYFFVNTFGRAMIVAFLVLAVPNLIIRFYESGIMRFITGTVCSELYALALIFFIGLAKNERQIVISNISKLLHRV